MSDCSSVADLVDLVRTKAVGRKLSTNRYVGLEHIGRGGGLIGTAPASVSDGVNGVFEPGDVLFGKLRPNLRKAVQPKFGGYCSTDILVLRPKPEHSPAFVKHAITADAVFRHAEANSIGTRMPRTSWPAVAEASVRIPPLDEQRRIAEILDALDLAIGATERLIAKLVSANSGLVESQLGELAATSTGASLASLADIGGGLALSSKRSVADPVTVPYLRVANVQDGFIDLSEVKSVTIGRRELKRFELRTGDVLMNEGGDFDKLGRGAIWDGSIARCVHQNHVFRVRCDAGRLLPKYLAICAASWRGKQYFTASSKQTTNLASINKAQLGKFPVPLVHVDQQRSFVVLVEQTERRLKAEDAALRKLRLVRSGLAGDLLTGRIRTVPV